MDTGYIPIKFAAFQIWLQVHLQNEIKVFFQRQDAIALPQFPKCQQQEYRYLS
ncbi:MAG: hypothetical protein AB1861_16335 [Cyanobacteriota bacterium]